ncbi:MAG: PAS domain-containing protein [Candidatus Eisenbacteria bacterium]|nr:PAS domain-containing protein [Candidatus Eisenbacteria bacterium]
MASQPADPIIPIVPIVPHMDIEQVRHILPELIDSMSDAVVVVDRQQLVVAANRRYLEAFGSLPGSVVRHHCQDALHCPEGAGARTGRCSACEAIEIKQPVRRMRNLTAPAGTQRRWEATFNPVLDASGEVTHVVEVWRDITERSELEAQLAHSERLASLGTLAAGVAHELNNPMAAILAGVERLQRWLSREPSVDPRHREEISGVLAGLERETQRCTETTEKLLLLAQPVRAATSWVDVNRAVRDTLSLLNYQISKQGIRTVQELDPRVPAVWARETGIRGVCMNLAMNAVQAMKDGGTLTMRTRSVDARVILEVEDTGPGILPEHLDRIWDPFFTTKPIGQGTGLGLSITRQVVARQDGSIRVETRPGHGARFIVELPVKGRGGTDG